MQTRIVLRATALLLSAAALAGCATTRSDSATTSTKALPNAEGSATLPDELAIAHPALYRAWQGTDPLAMRPWYADNAHIVTSNDEYKGWNDIQTRWLTPTLKAMSDFMAMPASFRREGNDIIETGRYSFRVTESGTVQQVRGAYAQRWQRQPNGNWRVVSANIVSEQRR